MSSAHTPLGRSVFQWLSLFLLVSTHRLSLNASVDLKKLRFFTIPHDSGSVWTNAVSEELMEVQRKVCQVFKETLRTARNKELHSCQPGLM